MNPSSPTSPPADENFDPPSPSKHDYDAHFGYSPSPSPPPVVANLLTQEQIALGMYKVEPGAGATGSSAVAGVPGNMGPPQPVLREESVDAYKIARGAGGGGRSRPFLGGGPAIPIARQKRKDRDSDEESSSRKKRPS